MTFRIGLTCYTGGVEIDPTRDHGRIIFSRRGLTLEARGTDIGVADGSRCSSPKTSDVGVCNPRHVIGYLSYVHEIVVVTQPFRQVPLDQTITSV